MRGLYCTEVSVQTDTGPWSNSRITLTRLIEEGLQLRLRAKCTGKRAIDLPIYHGDGGLISGPDGLSNKALLEAAEHDA